MTYDGSFVRGRKEGFGVEEKSGSQSGFFKEGTWKQDELDGPECRLLIYNERGEVSTEYKGGFKLGKYHGYGQLAQSDGHIYRGDFFENKRHGKGHLTV